MSDYLPSWQDDESVSSCCLCENAFTFFNRRHHCRKCGRVVCGNCSDQAVKYFPRTFVVSPNGHYRLHTSQIYRTCDECAEEIRMIRSAFEPAETQSFHSNHSVTKYSGVRTTTIAASSTNSSTSNLNDQTSDHNLCPVCATNLLDVYIKQHKKNIGEISNDSFEEFKEDHISDCLTSYDFDYKHERFSSTGHPRNKMLVYNMPPIPKPKFEAIPGTEGTSYDTIKQTHSTDSFNIGSVTSNSTFQQNEKLKEEDENECVICLEELKPGDKVGRLECLCVFHYKCIKDWFNRKGYGECPVHYLLH